MLLLWPAFCARANKKDCLSLSSMFVLLLPIPGAIKAVAGNELAADNLQVRPGREMRLNRIGVWVDGARYSSMWKSMIPFVIRYCTRFCLALFFSGNCDGHFRGLVPVSVSVRSTRLRVNNKKLWWMIRSRFLSINLRFKLCNAKAINLSG